MKRLRLVVIDSNEPSFTAEVHGGTWKRSECPTVRPCPRAFCSAHLYRIDGDSRPGRPSLALAPRDEAGHTIVHEGDLGDVRVGTLEPAWLDEKPRPSCSWDVIEKANGPLSNIEIGEVTGRHRTLIGRLIKGACESLAARGVSSEDIARLIDPQATNDRTREPSRSGADRHRALSAGEITRRVAPRERTDSKHNHSCGTPRSRIRPRTGTEHHRATRADRRVAVP